MNPFPPCIGRSSIPALAHAQPSRMLPLTEYQASYSAGVSVHVWEWVLPTTSPSSSIRISALLPLCVFSLWAQLQMQRRDIHHQAPRHQIRYHLWISTFVSIYRTKTHTCACINVKTAQNLLLCLIARTWKGFHILTSNSNGRLRLNGASFASGYSIHTEAAFKVSCRRILELQRSRNKAVNHLVAALKRHSNGLLVTLSGWGGASIHILLNLFD